MGGPTDYQAIAAQLANPTGEAGIRIAANMNASNGDMTRHAIDLLACPPHAEVLEIGPGNGKFASYVLSKGCGIHYTGADRSATMVAEAQRLNKADIDNGRMHFTWTDGITFPFADRSFDRIVTVNTLYFWEDPTVQLAEIRRLLKPDGIFCLAIASRVFMEQLPFTAHGFRLYSPSEAQALLLANGFPVVEMTIRHRPTTGPGKQELTREEVFICASGTGRQKNI